MGSVEGENNARIRQRFASIEEEILAQRTLIETEVERQRQQHVELRSALGQLLALIADNAELFEYREQEDSNSRTGNVSLQSKQQQPQQQTDKRRLLATQQHPQQETDNTGLQAKQHQPQQETDNSRLQSMQQQRQQQTHITAPQSKQQQHGDNGPDRPETTVVFGTLDADKVATPPTDLINHSLQKDQQNSPPSPKTGIIGTRGHLVREKSKKQLCDLVRQFLRSSVLPGVTVDDFRVVGRLTGISCDDLNPDGEDDAVGLVERMLRREMGGQTDPLLHDPDARKRFEAKLSKRKSGCSRSGRASIQALLRMDVLNSRNPHNGSLWHGVQEALKTAGDIPMAETSLDTVLCVDSSESIGDNALKDIKDFLLGFIKGLEETAENHNIEENVALVTFGGRPRVLRHLTNDYGSLRDAIEDISLGGHSPLLQGLLYCLACITRGGVCRFGQLKVPPRIVFITDGHASNECRKHTTDNRHISEQEKTKLLSIASVLSGDRSKQDIADPLVWVPVGNANKEFLRQMASASLGTYTSPSNLTTLCNYQKIKRVSANVLNYMKSHADNQRIIDRVIDAFGLDLRYDDKIQVATLVHNILNKGVLNIKSLDRFDNINIKENLPPLGSRVERGPDWMWDNQDSGLPGTVYNHGEEGESVWVLWDNGFNNVYRCGVTAGYDILPTDRPRQLLPDRLIDVGVQVERGSDWSHENQDGGPGNYGVVIRVRGLRVKVRWNNGGIHEYRFGEDNKFDVSVRNLMKAKDRNRQAPTSAKVSNLKQSTDHERQREEESRYVWQRQDRTKGWQNYTKEEDAKMKKEYRRNKTGTCLLQRNGQCFRIFFKNEVERCVLDDSLVRIRRMFHD
ncbi:uncharacterized protein LOC124280419 [Haliotis rubra]|uniref:uncharacterized protein LOC124280419 n=1 Tax=Haliotis rubra TaxID=36100 RepID=UPI001EE5D399|nr:uncharacterized protein LOC124280419 [Haliotis rubra]XP_046572314.1 uncharacterized protein LOC124280419 [Haliotis rubra]